MLFVLFTVDSLIHGRVWGMRQKKIFFIIYPRLFSITFRLFKGPSAVSALQPCPFLGQISMYHLTFNIEVYVVIYK